MASRRQRPSHHRAMVGAIRPLARPHVDLRGWQGATTFTATAGMLRAWPRGMGRNTAQPMPSTARHRTPDVRPRLQQGCAQAEMGANAHAWLTTRTTVGQAGCHLLAEARKLSTSREILLWMTPSEAPKALQASECSELLDPTRASC